MYAYYKILGIIDEMVAECLLHHTNQTNAAARALALARAGVLRGLARRVEAEIKLVHLNTTIELTEEMIVSKGALQ